MAKFIGQGGSIAWGGDTYCAETFTITDSSELQDVTDSCSGGDMDRIKGISSAELTASLFYDSDNAPFPSTRAGDTISLTGTIPTPGGDTTVSGSFLIASFAIENPAKNPVKINLTAQSTGHVSVS